MRRRQFLATLVGAAGWPLVVRAQKVSRIAVLTPSQSQWESRIFRSVLADLGYREGVNLQLEVASGDGQLDRLPELATNVAATAPDVIVAVNFPGARAAADATSHIPIVAAALGDPVLLGFVRNVARPEGNITGVANMASDLTSKRIALFKEVVPAARRFALFLHPDEPIVAPQLQDIADSADRLDIEYKAFPMRTVSDLQAGVQMAADWNAHAIVRLAGQGFALGADTARLSLARRLPAMLLQKSDVEAGGLMSYFADYRELWRRVSIQVDRILKGAAPRDLPFEFPTRFELIFNLKVAKLLGLTISPTFLARADEVIE